MHHLEFLLFYVFFLHDVFYNLSKYYLDNFLVLYLLGGDVPHTKASNFQFYLSLPLTFHPHALAHFCQLHEYVHFLQNLQYLQILNLYIAIYCKFHIFLLSYPIKIFLFFLQGLFFLPQSYFLPRIFLLS